MYEHVNTNFVYNTLWLTGSLHKMLLFPRWQLSRVLKLCRAVNTPRRKIIIKATLAFCYAWGVKLNGPHHNNDAFSVLGGGEVNKTYKSTNFACASSRLWSVMVIIWWRMSPMSCFLPSPSVPSCPCGGGSAMPPCTEWPARLTPPIDCMIRAWSSIVAAKESVHWATQIEKLIYEMGYNNMRRRLDVCSVAWIFRWIEAHAFFLLNTSSDVLA